MTDNLLLTGHRLGRLELPNRIVMAPMTRFRAAEDGTPCDIMADYYAQRAAAGLLITEGIWPSHDGQSGWRIPGLRNATHVAGWRTVTAAVHAAGGRIFAQLMHGGRNGHPLARIDRSVPLAPSAVANPEPIHLADGTKANQPEPGTMTVADIRTALDNYATAACNAISAGFDGVELHGANSYLIHQFLADNTNLRTDRYGGSVTNRIRFAVEAVDAVVGAIGAERTAIRLSPGNPQAGMREADPAPLYRRLSSELDRIGLAYLHLSDNDAYPALDDLRPRWSGPLIANVGENRAPTSREAGERVLASGRADLVSYGRAFIANPDLPARFAAGAFLNSIDERHLYTPGPRGYTDYPTLDPVLDAAAVAC